MTLRLSFAGLLGAVIAFLAGPVLARCTQNLVELGTPPGIQIASLDGFRIASGKLSNSRATITFIGHSTFQIDTPQGVRVLTDYNGMNGFGRKPDVVTMNNAHSTHFTDTPEDGIGFVLKGWPSHPNETEAKHEMSFKDLKVWNVPTNARDWYSNTARINGNSIFIYSIGELCIAHLGHLHHRLTKEHLEELGRIDVLMVPIDGSLTMGQPLMVDVIKQIQPKIVLPMHYWGRHQLDRFLGQMSEVDHLFVWPDSMTIEVTRESLPEKLTVIALGGEGGG
jgi:L-ascorbate metabolism protein UlaG (beta-lactamase superfamily)